MASIAQKLTTGKYLFLGIPEPIEGQNSMVTAFGSTAVHISSTEVGWIAKFDTYDISALISKTSIHLLEERAIEAHKLYTWPANLGDPKAWASSKQHFFEQHLMNAAIEILNVVEDQQITWKFIPLSTFKALIKETQAVTLLSEICPEL